MIDLVCYRRHGHNEGDEPSFTQPLLYEKIRQRKSTRRLYAQRLVEVGQLDTDKAQKIEEGLQRELQQALQGIQTGCPDPGEPYEPRGAWTGFLPQLPGGGARYRRADRAAGEDRGAHLRAAARL